jgi:hypothetical protein
MIDAVIVEIVLALAVAVIVLPVLLFTAAQKWATVSPRFGRWMDRSATRLSPRLGHLVRDPSRDRQDPTLDSDQRFDC